MTQAASAAAPLRRPADIDRRARIFLAAERAFVRHGFHAATMNHVAEEAGMSAGNLYRYFPSKEALVEDLCRCNRDERAAEFERLAAGGDLCGALAEMINERLLSQPRQKARLIVEMWAEAGRNARVGDITRAFDAATRTSLAGMVAKAKAAGAAPAELDPAFAARAIFTLVSGLLKRMAQEAEFDRQAEAEMALGILRALFAGAIAPAPGAAVEER